MIFDHDASIHAQLYTSHAQQAALHLPELQHDPCLISHPRLLFRIGEHTSWLELYGPMRYTWMILNGPAPNVMLSYGPATEYVYPPFLVTTHVSDPTLTDWLIHNGFHKLTLPAVALIAPDYPGVTLEVHD